MKKVDNLFLLFAFIFFGTVQLRAGGIGADPDRAPDLPEHDVSVFFDEAAAERAGVVTLASGLQYLVLDSGDADLRRAERKSDWVEIWQRNAYRTDDVWTWREFSRSSGQIDDYIDPYAEGLQLMRPGAHCIFYIPPTDSGPSERFIETVMVSVAEAGSEESDESEECFDEEGFFVQNGLCKGVVALRPGLQYEVLKKGRGPLIGADDEVYVDYSAMPLHGHAHFEPGRGEFRRTCGEVSDFIPGIEQGLQLMRPGARYVFWVGEDWSGSSSPSILEIEVLCVYRASRRDSSDR